MFSLLTAFNEAASFSFQILDMSPFIINALLSTRLYETYVVDTEFLSNSSGSRCATLPPICVHLSQITASLPFLCPARSYKRLSAGCIKTPFTIWRKSTAPLCTVTQTHSAVWLCIVSIPQENVSELKYYKTSAFESRIPPLGDHCGWKLRHEFLDKAVTVRHVPCVREVWIPPKRRPTWQYHAFGRLLGYRN